MNRYRLRNVTPSRVEASLVLSQRTPLASRSLSIRRKPTRTGRRTVTGGVAASATSDAAARQQGSAATRRLARSTPSPSVTLPRPWPARHRSNHLGPMRRTGGRASGLAVLVGEDELAAGGLDLVREHARPSGFGTSGASPAASARRLRATGAGARALVGPLTRPRTTDGPLRAARSVPELGQLLDHPLGRSPSPARSRP